MMAEGIPNQPNSTQPRPIGQRERSGQERTPQSDTSPRLLSDMVGSLQKNRASLPDIESAFLPNQGVILKVTAVEREGKHGTVRTDVGFHWKGKDGGQLSLSKPASRIKQVLFGATVNRQGLPEDARGIEREFARAGVDSGVAITPLLYSVVSRNPDFATQTDFVQRAEALGVTTIGTWDAGEGQRNGAMLFAQDGRVIRVDTPEANLTTQDAVRARELIQRSDVQALFGPNDKAVRLRLISDEQDGVTHRTLSYGDRAVDVIDEKVPDVSGMEPHQAIGVLAGQEPTNTPEAEHIQDVLFGPLGRDAYPPYAQAKIEAQFGDAANVKGREDRTALWHNYDDGLQAVIRAGNGDVVEATYAYVKTLNAFANNQLEHTPEGGLGLHLKEITAFSHNFLLDAEGNSRFPDLISTHNAQLFADVIAPMHDVLKFLGSTDAQVMPDHEAITAAFVRGNFTGRQVLLNGQPYSLTPEDATFIAGVIEDHENIEKPNEADRSGYIHGTELEKAKALFFVADVLTGAVVPEADGTFAFDLSQLDTRFTDLYFRHIDLVKGKIFRPQWGAHTIGDLLATFDTLEQQGFNIAPAEDGRNRQEILTDAAIEAIFRARQADASRKTPHFTEDQLIQIELAEAQLFALRGDAMGAERVGQLEN